jgi:hypothetical protein
MIGCHKAPQDSTSLEADDSLAAQAAVCEAFLVSHPRRQGRLEVFVLTQSISQHLIMGILRQQSDSVFPASVLAGPVLVTCWPNLVGQHYLGSLLCLQLGNVQTLRSF